MRVKQSYNVKLSFNLSDEDRKIIDRILTKGKTSARVFKRAQVLRHFDEGNTSPAIAIFVGVTAETVRKIGWHYVREGLERALYDLPRPGKDKKLTDRQVTHIVALVCSDPPEGYERWTLRLLANELVSLELVDSISHVAVGEVLKKTNSSPGK